MIEHARDSRELARRPGRRRAGGEDGQALVEFALIAPILLVLVFGIFDLGMAWNAYQVITDAAREGARSGVIATGATNQTVAAQVEAAVEDAIDRTWLKVENATITVVVDPATRGPLEVDVAYAHRFLFIGPLIGWVSSQSDITLRTEVVMRKEW